MDVNDVRLTARQSACISLVADGLSSKEIARELGISPSTVDNHIATAMHQFGFPNRSAVARWYAEYRDSVYREDQSQPRAVPGNSNGLSNIRVPIPAMGGIRNTLKLKERIFGVAQVAIVSIMVASAAAMFVLGLIFLLKLRM